MMAFGAASYHWTLALVMITLACIDGEDVLNPQLQRHIEKRIFCNTYAGCKSWLAKRAEVSKRQRPLRIFGKLASLKHSERGHAQGAPLLLQDIDSGQGYQADAPKFINRPLPPLVTWLQKRREFENENEARMEDEEERFWRIVLTALTSTIKSTQADCMANILTNTAISSLLLSTAGS